jgi:branched-chain amino acid transport system ATP-binding protein
LKLRVADLHLTYADVPALVGVSLEIDAGEVVSVVGANGAGKSSLIRSIAGMEKPSSGSIWFEDRDVTGLSSYDTCNLGIGQVAEGRQLFGGMTVEDNLVLGAALPRARPHVRSGLADMYRLFPRLAERKQQLAGTLSGGEQQMLAIARCLMSRPTFVMFDEPTLGLAPAIVHEVFRSIVQLQQQGVTVLLVEQNVVLSLQISTRAYVLENGRIVMSGSGTALLHDDRVRQAYLGL